MVKLTVDATNRVSKINKEIYGHFSEHLGRCIYEGIYVGENSDIPNKNGMRTDVVEALKNIKVPVLRWPGGCFADEYHWKDGIGEKAMRKKMINTHWGGLVEDNSFGTHEFMELCEQLGCEPYISGNVGSGTVQEMSEWVEYMTFDGVSPMAELRKKNGHEKPWKVKYFGIGNESWGCGGNMRAEYYSDLCKHYATYCRNYGENQLYKIACGPSGDDYNWTRTIMKNLNNSWLINAISLHYYTIPTGNWDTKGPATEFSDEIYYGTVKNAKYIANVIDRHIAIMDEFDPENKIGLAVDEWGTWYDVEKGTNLGFLYQQNTMRDAIVAASSLDIYNARSKRIIMANIAQVVNVLQSVILTEGERIVKTPTYHVFDLYKEHQDAQLVYSHTEKIYEQEIDILSHSVSVKNNKMLITASNASLDKEIELECEIGGFDFSSVSGKILTAEVHAYNDFDNTENVAIKELEGIAAENGTVKFTLPPCSVVAVTLS